MQTSYSAGLITEIDHEVAGIAQALLTYFTRRGGARLDRICEIIVDSKLLLKVLLCFSDQQMVTGFAMLTVGLVQINSITEYHFAIVQNLSILSFVVHDTTAVILQDEIVQHRMTRHWRGVVVVGSMLITIAIQLPSGHYYSVADYGLPVKCIWTSMEGIYRPRTSRLWLMVMWMDILSYSLAQTLCVYFPNAFGRLMDNTVVQATSDYMMDKLLAARDTYDFRAKRPRGSVVDRCLTGLAKGAAVCIFVITEVLSSQAFGLQLRWMVMPNSIIYIFYLRNTASENGRQGDEDEWGFGQAVPMFLLILPIVTFAETTWGILIYDFKSDGSRLTSGQMHSSDQRASSRRNFRTDYAQLFPLPLYVHRIPGTLPRGRATKAQDTTLATKGDPEPGTWRSGFTSKLASGQ